jgi:hypothetical protein
VEKEKEDGRVGVGNGVMGVACEDGIDGISNTR